MQYPKIDPYRNQTPIVSWIDDRAVMDTPVWRSHDDEFTARKYFPTLAQAIREARKAGHFVLFDGHRHHEIFQEAA